MNELKDIQPILDLNDSSLYVFIGLIIGTAIVIGVIGYFIFKIYKQSSRDPRKHAVSVLKNINFSNPRRAAYRITKYSAFFPSNPHLHELLLDLEQYKYKKDIPDFKDNSRKIFDTFLLHCNIK